MAPSRRVAQASRAALMMGANSERDADMYYAVGCSVPDPFLYFRVGGRSVALVSDLEYDRVRKQAKVQRVERYSLWAKKAEGLSTPRPSLAGVAAFFLKKHGVRKVVVPSSFPFGLATALTRLGVSLEAKSGPFWEERAIKRRDEVSAIARALASTEAAIHKAEDHLRRSVILGNRILHRRAVVTSESLRRLIDVALLEDGCVANHTIVASGDQGCDPHQEGTGPIRPHQSLVVDVFPRSSRTFYFADITRTFVKGRASEALRRQYAAVEAAQAVGLRAIREGAQGREVHFAVAREMEARGYKTERRGGAMTGFFHGTGHGGGLEIHEAPRVNATPHVLRTGEVVTVEPGLYYPGVGAVRLEDMVYVTAKGNRNLTKYPRKLEIR